MNILREAFRRGSLLVALVALFLVIGAPGGGRGSITDKPYATPIIFCGGCILYIAALISASWTRRPSEQPLAFALILEGDTDTHRAFFTRLLEKGDFRAPGARQVALRTIADYLTPLSTSNGFVHILPSQGTSLETANYAAGLARQQMKRVDLIPNTINGAVEGRQIERQSDPGSRPSTADTNGYFVLSITATLFSTILAPFPTGASPETVSALLKQLTTAPLSSLDALYLFYAPGGGETLTQIEAKKMLTDLEEMTIVPPQVKSPVAKA